MFVMGLEFDRNETNELKEKYGKDDAWVQKLFNGFYETNWHLPNEITAMRELLYEKTGVKVIKPGTAKIVVDSYNPNFGKSQAEYGGVPEEEYDWSHYDKKEKTEIRKAVKPKKPYQVLHCINHVRKDYVTKESMKENTALKHYQDFYMHGYNGHSKLATALVENAYMEEDKELLTMSFVQDLDFDKGEKGFSHIYEDFVALYLDMFFAYDTNHIKTSESFRNSFVVKPEQCKQYKEAMMSFIEKVTEWKHGKSTEKVMSFEKSKMKNVNYYLEVKKRISYQFHTDIIDFIKHHEQIEINGVIFEFKFTSKNTAIIHLYFGEKGAALIGKL